MKLTHLIVAAIAALAVSCGSLTFQPARDGIPLGTVATVAYLQQVPEAKRPAAAARVREAATKIQLVALSENPTAEALKAAMDSSGADPAWKALTAALIDAYQPQLAGASESELKVSLVAISEGMLRTAALYESSK